MAETVTETNEIYLGGTRFRIKGSVNENLISQFASKIVVGDYSKDSEQLASSWIVSDQRGGILIEEMVEAIHQDRAWWSTCNLSYKGHTTLPPFVTEATLPDTGNTTVTVPNGDCETDGGWSAGSRSAAAKQAGTYGWLVAPGNNTAYLPLGWSDSYQSTEIKISGYCCNASTDGTGSRIGIYDGKTYTWSTRVTGSTHTTKTVTKTLAADATLLRIYVQSGTTYNGYFDTFTCDQIPKVRTPIVQFCNFNNENFLACGNMLCKVNSGGTGFDLVHTLPSEITALIASVGTNLYIYQGDDYFYFYMSTGGTLSYTISKDANKGVHWDSKLWKIDTDGQIAYCATPNTANPTWTDNGKLDLPSAAVQHLLAYRDVSGNFIIYAACKDGFWAHDTANAVWEQTELVLPPMTYSAQGAVNWRDAIFISNGLAITKYKVGTPAVITVMGLERDDGLPEDLAGQIVALVGGYNDVFALVDSSLATGTGYSSVMAYDAVGWQCRWQATNADKTMHCGIVSDDFAYRFWFDHNSKVYYFALEENIRNPLKIPTFPYAASSIHITSWFDGGWANLDKLADTLTLFCKGMSSTEKVTVKYRLDHSYDDIDTGWTTLKEITENDETEIEFGAGDGTVFKAIQFRFDFARGDTNTDTPDLQWFSLKFLKLLETKWGWTVNIDCGREYKDSSPSQLVNAIKDLADTKTLLEFTYRDSIGGEHTYKVKIANAQGLEATGEDWRGFWQVSLVAP